MKRRIIALAATCALATCGMVAAPIVGDAPIASANAFTCVHFKNSSGGYSLADGCRGSQYLEKVNGRWKAAKEQPRGYKSEFMACFAGYQASSYRQII